MELNIASISNEIKDVTNEINDEIVDLRRTFHQYPELSWKEIKTGKRLEGILKELNMDVNGGVCGTGVVAEMQGMTNGKTVALRADMDALPLDDVKDVSYASKIPGVMHACGHDTHMAMAIGVAKVLKRLNLNIPGNVRFIFQPSEEAVPSGASELVKEHVMDNVTRILAFHVDPTIEVGKIGLRSGVLTANCDEFKLSIFGKSGHGARPHLAIDTIYTSTQVLNALYEIVANRHESYWPAVLSVGKIVGGTKANVIPEKVELFGTIRTVDESNRNEIISAIETRVYEITRAVGATYQLVFPGPVPSVFNDAETINLFREAAQIVCSDKTFVNIENISMGGEDFSWYLTKAPGALVRLGVRKPEDEIHHLHTHDFDIDENALQVGINIMTTTVLKYLFDKNLN